MQLRFADCAVDTDQRQVFRGGCAVALSPKAYHLLLLLLEARPKALAREALYLQLWPDTFVVEANLPNLIGEIRAALGDSPRRPRFIRTLHGFGYAFSFAVEVDSPSADAGERPPYWILWKDNTLPLKTGENVIGRNPGVQVRLDESGVSRRHARLLVAAHGATLEDLQSKNGTFVNGERIATVRELVSEDELRFGPVTVTFHGASHSSATQTLAEPEEPGDR
jgi:DNA-binding winged helix-turn-helix (wHTH) protein